MKQYLKLVDEDLKAEEVKVTAQQKVVVQAEAQVEAARKDLFQKQKDIEKLKIHHKEWEKEMKVIEERAEGNENDEVGSTRHTLRKAARKRKDG
jgi:flagellar biosynthesis chaperone FliJ